MKQIDGKPTGCQSKSKKSGSWQLRSLEAVRVSPEPLTLIWSTWQWKTWGCWRGKKKKESQTKEKHFKFEAETHFELIKV